MVLQDLNIFHAFRHLLGTPRMFPEIIGPLCISFTIPLLSLFLKLHFFFCACTVLSGGQRTAFGNWFSASTMLIPGNKLKLSDLAGSTCTRWAISRDFYLWRPCACVCALPLRNTTIPVPTFWLCCCCFVLFEIKISLCVLGWPGTHCGDQAGLMQRSVCLCIPVAGIEDVYHHTWPWLDCLIHLQLKLFLYSWFYFIFGLLILGIEI